jgi:SAM-dependent methyltransferase
MSIQKQVNKTHYDFNKYVGKDRWSSFYYQIDEILKAEPDSILEVDVGAGITKCVLKDILHYNYESMDVDEELHPDHTGSILALPFPDKQYDVIGCFQVLEHLPFNDFKNALFELFRVAKKAVILSLPNAEPVIRIQTLGFAKEIFFKKPFTRRQQNTFDGEHYWEINKIGYELNKVTEQIISTGDTFNFVLEKEYRAFEHPFHHFFVLKKIHKSA